MSRPLSLPTVLALAACVVASTVAATPAFATTATHRVTYAGVTVSVPTSWPVVDVAGRTGCVRYDRHAVYLGTPASSDCRSDVVGHLTTVQILSSGSAPTGPSRGLPGGLTVTGGTQVSPDLTVTSTHSAAQVMVTSGDTSATQIADSVTFTSAAPPAPTTGRKAESDPPESRPSATPETQVAAAAPAATYSGPGFDTCEAPSTVQMTAWTASPYRAIGVYIGGANRACGQPNLTAGWVTAVHNQGWHLIPTYVGLQAPCTDSAHAFSLPTAAADGKAAADDAVTNGAVPLGLGAGNPIYYDMEAYDTTNASCVAAVKAFIDAWTAELHAQNYVSGVYGSAGSMMTNLVQFVSNPKFRAPDDIWYAHYDGHASTTNDPYIPNDNWNAHQRIHQYQGGHDESFGGVKMNVDSDQLDGATTRPSVAAVPNPPEDAGAFVPLVPYRALDTRNGIGATQAAVAAGGTVALTVAGTGGSVGVPAAGVAAVVVNVTVTAPTAPGSITVYPDGSTRPTASNVNFVKGQSVPNLVVSKVANGKIDLYNGSAGTVQLIADITGYYLGGTPTAPGTFVPLAPHRVLDTRHGIGAPQAPVQAGHTATLTVAGSGGVPTTGIAAVVLNVTVTAPTAAGSITVYPDGPARPAVSNLNFVEGQTVPNLVVSKVAGGKIDLYNGSAGAVQLIADVTGYYLAGTPKDAGTYVSLTPYRALDTRYALGAPQGPVAGQTKVDFTATGTGGSGGVPTSGVAAVVVNVTVASPAAPGAITVYSDYPDDRPRPYASNLNFVSGQSVPNLVVSSVPPATGKLHLYNGSAGAVQLIGDISGYFLTGAA
ncbi:MAG: DUF1906 domain-containing protein [Actinomycetota bacterium]|nr:DUF1906 domain-containing protein [Actinomycetota bacterium]